MSDPQMSDGEKVFLATIVFLVLKGLLNLKDAEDKERVRKTWKRVKAGEEATGSPTWDDLAKGLQLR